MSDLSEFVTLTNATLVTDSRRVAKHFKRRHADVLRAYDCMRCSAEFNQRNFASVEDLDAKGEMRRMIRMTQIERQASGFSPRFERSGRDGLLLLNVLPQYFNRGTAA